MSEVLTQEKCSKDCEGFTGELWNPKNRKDLFIYCVSGGIPNSYFYMPSPHAVEIGMKCKFGSVNA